jgi:hypothetical protein
MMFSSHTRFELKNESKIRFLDDVWYGEMALKEAFTDLYSIICVKDAFLAIHLDLSSGSLKWNVSFIKEAHILRVDVLASFFNLLYSYRVRREREDKFW